MFSVKIIYTYSYILYSIIIYTTLIKIIKKSKQTQKENIKDWDTLCALVFQ